MGTICIPDDLYESPGGMLRARPMNVDPVHRIAVHVLVTNGGGRILLVKPAWSGRWELPGGIVDPVGGALAINEACSFASGYRIMVRQGVLYTTERKRLFQIDRTYCRLVVYIYNGVVTSHHSEASLRDLGEKADVEWLLPRQLRRRDCHPAFWPILRSIVRNGKKAA